MSVIRSYRKVGGTRLVQRLADTLTVPAPEGGDVRVQTGEPATEDVHRG